MEQNPKPFYKFVAEKLISQLKDGTSSFQKPVKANGTPSFVLPMNPSTGRNYKGLNALALSLRGFDDPRFMTMDQANFASMTVMKGAKGTKIEFNKTSDIQAVRTPDGKKITDAEGKTVTKTVDFEKPVKTLASLFNGEQINGMPPMEERINFEPLEKADKLLTESNAVIIHGGEEAYYDKLKDAIFLPEKERFATPERYYQAAIHQLAHWTGYESRLNRSMEGKLGSADYAKEEFRASLAAQMIGSELKIGHNFGQHESYSHAWIKLLKDDPFQVVLAAKDAQKIADTILSIGQKQDIKQEILKKEDQSLKLDESIPYKNTEYKVIEVKRNGNVKLEDLTGNRMMVKPTDTLYKNLVDIRNNPDLVAEQVVETGQLNENQFKRKI